MAGGHMNIIYYFRPSLRYHCSLVLYHRKRPRSHMRFQKEELSHCAGDKTTIPALGYCCHSIQEKAVAGGEREERQSQQLRQHLS